MNLLRRFISRRKASQTVDNERRKPSIRDVDERLFSAIHELEQTVIRTRKPVVVHDSPWSHVEFSSFAETCSHRYKNGGLFTLCRHPEHEAHRTGMASCNKNQCPRGREAKK